MKTWTKADAQTLADVADLMARHHSDLASNGVTVEVLMVLAPVDEDSGQPKGPALTVRGLEAAACIKVVGTRERAAGMADALMVVDGDRWPERPRREQRAILDHELTHLEVIGQLEVVDGQDEPVFVADRDTSDRPRLRLRHHDREFGWFDEIARRHGDASLEVRQARELFEDERGQVYLPGMDEGRGSVIDIANPADMERLRSAMAELKRRGGAKITTSVDGEVIAEHEL